MSFDAVACCAPPYAAPGLRCRRSTANPGPPPSSALPATAS